MDSEETDTITEEDLMNIAAEAALAIPGVSGFSSTWGDTLSAPLKGIGFSSGVRGMKMSEGKNGLIFDLYIDVEYGIKIPQLAWDIQSAVQHAVEKCGEAVEEVNIHVQGVRLE